MTAPAHAYDVDSAADVTPFHANTIRRAIRKYRSGENDGVFPPPLRAKFVGKYVILAADLDAWLDALPDA